MACRCLPEDAGSESVTRCVPGVYKGRQDGKYKGGIPGLLTLIDIDIAAPMTFTLEQDVGEFAPVKDGCARVPAAEGAPFPYQSVIAIDGEVDCNSGALSGVLRAFYMLDLGSGPQRVFFKGQISGVYDPESRTFGQAMWEGHEPPNLFPGDVPGGSGTWTATLVEEDVMDDAADCLGVPFPEEKFTP